QAGDVHKLHSGGYNSLRFYNLCQSIKTRIRHRHNTAVRLDGAEREVLSCDAGLGESVEQSGLANVGQSYDATLETHERNSCNRLFLRASFISCGAAVQLLHGLVPLAVDHQWQNLDSLPDIVFDLNGVVLAGIAEDVSCNLALVTGMSHANAQSVKTVGATKRLDNVTHAIMAAMTTTGLDARSANREIDFVVGNQNLLRCNIK